MTLQDEIKLLLEAPTMNAADVRTLLRQDHDELLQFAGTCTNRRAAKNGGRCSGN